jgi:ubiquitin-like-conjugating enzyme ATG3
MVPGMKSLHAAYKKVAESVLPPLSSSQFQKKGVITGEEFVRAGDYLVSTCPTWAWEAGDTSKSWSFLPPAKQFLITRNGEACRGVLSRYAHTLRCSSIRTYDAPCVQSELNPHFCRRPAAPWRRRPAVPCLRRASAVEEYSTLLADDAEDVEREADAEGGGWLEAGAPAADADDGFEQLPQLSKPQGPLVEIGGGDEEAEEAARAAAAPGGGGQEEEEEAPLPDISALDVDAPDDDDDAVVSQPTTASLRRAPLPGTQLFNDPGLCVRLCLTLPHVDPASPAPAGAPAAAAAARRRPRHPSHAHLRPAHHIRQLLPRP